MLLIFLSPLSNSQAISFDLVALANTNTGDYKDLQELEQLQASIKEYVGHETKTKKTWLKLPPGM